MYPHIHIIGIELSTWRLTALAGILLCWALFLPRAKRLGYPLGLVVLLVVLALPAGMVGGNLFNRLIPWAFGLPGVYRESGITVIGSIVFVLVFGLLYARFVLKADPMPLLDAVAFTLPLSILIGRLGCLLSGCCFGRIASPSLGDSLLSLFTLPVDLYAADSQAGQALAGVARGTLLWNLPLFLMLNALFVLITAEMLYRNRERWRLVPGTVMAATAAQYAGGRFLMEFLRRDDLVGGTRYNPWQLAVLALFVVSLVWLVVCLARRRTDQRHAGS